MRSPGVSLYHDPDFIHGHCAGVQLKELFKPAEKSTFLSFVVYSASKRELRLLKRRIVVEECINRINDRVLIVVVLPPRSAGRTVPANEQFWPRKFVVRGFFLDHLVVLRPRRAYLRS